MSPPEPGLGAAAERLLDRPNFAHVATLMRDGSPHVVPVWIGRDAQHVLFYKEEASITNRNLSRARRIAISLVDRDDPYRGLYLRGRMIDRWDRAAAAAWFDAVTDLYTSSEYPGDKPGPGVVAVIEVDRLKDFAYQLEDSPRTHAAQFAEKSGDAHDGI